MFYVYVPGLLFMLNVGPDTDKTRRPLCLWNNPDRPILSSGVLLDKFTAQCRHTFATRLGGLGVSDAIIDQLLGHSPRGVLRFYTARVPEYLRDAINLLEKLRSAKTGPSAASEIGGIREPVEKGPSLIN